jgi:hypothetical protein
VSAKFLNYWPPYRPRGADECALRRAPRGSGSNRALNDNASISTAEPSWSRALAHVASDFASTHVANEVDAKREDKQRAEEYAKDTDPTPIVVEASDDLRARWVD